MIMSMVYYICTAEIWFSLQHKLENLPHINVNLEMSGPLMDSLSFLILGLESSDILPVD